MIALSDHGGRQLALQLNIGSAVALLPLEILMASRALCAEEAETLVDTGKIGWCFDIAAPDSRRREIRILRESLLGIDLQLEEALTVVLPASAGPVTHHSYRAKWIARRWSCSPSHIINLIAAKQLESPPVERSAKQSPLVTRASLVKFLRARATGPDRNSKPETRNSKP